MVNTVVQKSNGNGFTRYIMAGILTLLIVGSFSWTTVVFFSLSKKIDNHLYHIQSSLDKIDNKVGSLGERLSTIEGGLRVGKRYGNQN